MNVGKLSILGFAIFLGNSVSLGGLGFEAQNILAEQAVPDQAPRPAEGQASPSETDGVATRTPLNPEQPLFADILDAELLEESTDPAVIRSRLVDVDFGQLTLLGRGEQDSVILELFDDLVTAVVKRVEYRDASNITLHGVINGEPGGTFTLVVAAPIVVANIRVPGIGFYQVRYLTSGIHVIHEVDESRYPECGGGIEPNVHQPGHDSVDEDHDAASGGDTEIDVLILYTGQARAAAGGTAGMIALITLAVAESNGAYENSSIIPRFQLVHTQEVEYTEPTGSDSFELMLSDLQTGANGLGVAHTLRDAHCADMVSLFVGGLEFCGIGYLMPAAALPPFDFAPWAFSVENWQCAGGNLTLPHELGHNVGCHHNRENACFTSSCSTLCCAGDSALEQGLGAYEHSYGHRIAGLWRTIMSYNAGCSCAKIPYFSNPNVLYAGNPTGIPGGHPSGANNALTINNTATIAANWRSSVCGASTVYVDADASGPSHDGLSWCGAFTDLQDALDGVVAGAEIHVAGGVYKPDRGSGDRSAAFHLVDGVAHRGGYAGCGATDPDERDTELYETILSGDLDGNDGPDFENNEENSYHVVTYGTGNGPSTLLDGFTVTSGNADGPSPYHHSGGGIGALGSSGSPTIINCTIRANHAANCGGGMSNLVSNTSIANCVFEGNSADGQAGGLCNILGDPSVSGCVFVNNYAATGGAVYSSNSNVLITSSAFEGNSANNGGAIYSAACDSVVLDSTFTENAGSKTIWTLGGSLLLAGSTFVGHSSCGVLFNRDVISVVIRNCTFLNNELAMMNSGSSPVVTSCAFIGNHDGPSCNGGAVWNGNSNPLFRNCIFSGNTSMAGGGALANYIASSPSLTGCTFSGNSANDAGVAIYSSGAGSGVTLRNCIVWGTSAVGLIQGPANITYSDVLGGYEGDGNFDLEPLFVDADGPDNTPGTEDDDLHLLPESPCINTGDPAFVQEPEETDLDGDLRVMGCRVDMGSDEFYPDCNQNGVMDDDDLSSGDSLDCNDNCTPDECDLPDCNLNDIPDECEPDTDGDGVIDGCDNCALFNPDQADCQPNGIGDVCDLDSGASEDCNTNDTPDECDIASGESGDCQSNGVPDECDPDTDGDDVADDCDNCELFNPGQEDCQPNGTGDVCDIAGGISEDCNENGTPDECDLASGTSQDCNENAAPDECDLVDGTSDDCDGNSVPDECEPDCNENNQADACDITAGISVDCNDNAVPDECEEGLGPIIIVQPMSQEAAPGSTAAFGVLAEGILPQYQWRKDGLDLIHSERIFGVQASQLFILDVVPADAGDYDCVVTDLFTGCSTVSDVGVLTVVEPCPADLDGSGDVAAADLAMLLGSWGPCPGCPAEFDDDGEVAASDLAFLLGSWGPCE